jgi:hypothetical protein
MLFSEMTHGTRVRIVNAVEIFDLGIYETGMTGVVIRDGYGPDDDGIDSPCCAVKLDKNCPELSEWDNELQVFFDTSDTPVCTPDDFAPL